MITQIALLISALVQVAAAIVATGLLKRTHFRISWILISIGFILMAFRRLFEVFSFYGLWNFEDQRAFNSWNAVLISVLLFAGLIYIRRIFSFQEKLDKMKQENEVRVLTAMVEGEEKARQSFARELHDGLGPLLASVKMSVSVIRNIPLDPVQQKIIEKTDQMIDESITVLKEISDNLSPHILKNFGLEKAIRTFLENLVLPDHFHLIFDSSLKHSRYQHTTEIVLYRAACELLVNTLKHALASEVRLILDQKNGYLELFFSDNGVGFNPDEIKEGGTGLANISTRIRSLNGQFELKSAVGKGMQVKIRVMAK